MTSFNFLSRSSFLTAQSMVLTVGVIASSLFVATPSFAQSSLSPKNDAASSSPHAQPLKAQTSALQISETTASKSIDLRGRGTAPTDRGNHASRGCGVKATRMLIPYIESEGYQAMLTSTTAPVLWMHIPYSAEEFESMEVLVWDTEAETYVYTANIDEIGQAPGTIGVNLPAGTLQAGKRYQWFVDVSYACDAGDGAIVTGTDSQEGSLEIGSWPTTWYSTMSEAAQRLCAGGSVNNWESLLSEINYGNLAASPVTACLSPAATR